MQNIKQLTYNAYGAQKPTKLLILLHGYGSNGNNMMPIAVKMAESLSHIKFIMPNAPFVFEAAPELQDAYQWFSLANRSPASMLAGASSANPILAHFIKTQAASNNVAMENVIMMGFSQGGMMSLYTGLRMEEAVGMIVSCAGAMVGGEVLHSEIGRLCRSSTKVLLAHGNSDTVVPVFATQGAYTLLQSLGVQCSMIVEPGLDHSINDQIIAAAIKFCST